MKEKAEEKKYLKLWNQMAFGMGDAGGNCFYCLISAFLLIYLTDAVGLNAGIIGSLMMVSRLLDGVSDIIFGRILDKTHTRWGKARPWFIGSAIPLALCTVLLFSIPTVFSESAQYAYFFVVYTSANAIFYTANNISYTTLIALVTKNPTERVQMGSFRFIFTTVIYIPMTAGAIPMVAAFGGGTKGWRMTAIVFALILIVLQVICVLSVKELPEGDSGQSQGVEDVKFFQVLKVVLKNKYYLQMLSVQILSYITTTLISTMGVYYCMYILNNPSFLGVLSMASMIMIPGLIISPILSKKFGMYKVMVIGYIIGSILGIPLIFAGYRGMGMLIMIFMGLRYFVTAPFSGSSGAFIAEISTYTSHRDGLRVDGTMYSCSSVGMKVGGGLGTAISGWLLNIGGYNGAAAVQTDSAINMIKISYLVIPAVLYIITAMILSRMKVIQANREWEKEHGIES